MMKTGINQVRQILPLEMHTPLDVKNLPNDREKTITFFFTKDYKLSCNVCVDIVCTTPQKHQTLPIVM